MSPLPLDIVAGRTHPRAYIIIVLVLSVAVTVVNWGDFHGQGVPLVDLHAGCPAKWRTRESGGLAVQHSLLTVGARLKSEC